MNELEQCMTDMSVSIMNRYKVPKNRYSIFEIVDNSYSLHKEDDYYTLYWLENFTKRLIIKSRNIKFVFSYLVMYCVPPQYKYEARQKFINKVKMEEK